MSKQRLKTLEPCQHFAILVNPKPVQILLHITQRPKGPMGSTKPVRLCICSDTHGQHEDLPISASAVESLKIDALLHCGDFTNWGNPEHLHSFNAWLQDLPLPKERKIVICGNHDSSVLFEMKHKFKVNFDKHLDSATLLCDKKRSVVLEEGLVITGIPYTNPHMAESRFWLDKLQNNTDILLTHNAVPGTKLCKENMGCASLREAVLQFYEMHSKVGKRDLLHCFGHVHDKYGTEFICSDESTQTKLLCVNASNVSGDRQIKYPPVLIDCFPNGRDTSSWRFEVVKFEV